jgi:hypothetical protein
MPQKTEDPNLWTVTEAARWSQISYRSLLAMLRDGQAPCLRVGGPQIQKMGRGRKKRSRTCARFLVPRVAFCKWFEGIQPAGSTGQKRIA